MNGDTIAGMTPEEILRHPKIVRHNEATEAIAQATSTPLPGPLRNAFAPNPNIQVGEYTVRPFVDRDFEYLQALEHPLHKHILTEESQQLGTMSRGPYAWQLCWIFTRSFKDFKKIMVESGPEALRKAAEEQFEECDLRVILPLAKAIFRQAEIYCEPILQYTSADDPEPGVEKKTSSKEPPQQPQIASDGS